MKKTSLRIYDPQIYPRKIWIVLSEDFERIKNMFTFYYATDMDKVNRDPILDLGMIAGVYPVERKSDGLYGALLVIHELEEFTPGLMAHEAIHIADYICEQLDIVSNEYTQSNEHYAYLVGWITGKISDFLIEILDELDGRKEE